MRLRFFARMHEVSHELLDKLIHYDPACAMAFVAIDEQTGKLLGVVRCMMTSVKRLLNLPFWCARDSRVTESVGC